MEAKGFIPILVELLNSVQYRFPVLVLLYQITNSNNLREKFAYPDCIELVTTLFLKLIELTSITFLKKLYRLIINFPEPIVGKELMAIAVNLTTNKKCADMFGQGKLIFKYITELLYIHIEHMLDSLFERAFKQGDILLFKMIRNISQFASDPEIHDNLKV